MFLLRDIFRSICRRKGFSLLTAAAGAFLFLLLGIYLGNMKNSQIALDTLGKKIPVTAVITNENGTEDIGLEITAGQLDAFTQGGIKNLVCTAQAGGMRKETDEETVMECDTSVSAANSLDAFVGLTEESFSFLPGGNSSYLTGQEPVCTVEEGYSRLYGIKKGDFLELSLYQFKYNGDGISFQFHLIGRTALKVIGIYSDTVPSRDSAVSDVLVSAEWLRQYTESQGKTFYYASARGELADASNLNKFKESMEKSFFGQPKSDSQGGKRGGYLLVQDQMYIETAERLIGNIRLYQGFQGSFFVLIYGVSVLLPFLLLRNRQREAAIALSLGCSRLLTGLGLLGEFFFLEIIGCIVSFPILRLSAGISFQDTGEILRVYGACLVLGACTALTGILRFDVMKLLSKID